MARYFTDANAIDELVSQALVNCRRAPVVPTDLWRFIELTAVGGFRVGPTSEEPRLDDVVSLGVVESLPWSVLTRLRDHVNLYQVPRWRNWDVRDTGENLRIARGGSSGIDVRGWHRDCGEGSGCPWLVLWSDTYPTELQLPDGTITSGEPGEFVLFRNTVLRHRTPTAYVDAALAGRQPARYLARAIIEGEITQHDVDGWRSQVARLRETLAGST